MSKHKQVALWFSGTVASADRGGQADYIPWWEEKKFRNVSRHCQQKLPFRVEVMAFVWALYQTNFSRRTL